MKIWLIRLVIVGGFLTLWEGGSGTLFDGYFVSKPSAVVEEFWQLLASGKLFYHAAITISEALAGFVCGGMVGAATIPSAGPSIRSSSSSTACPRWRSRRCSSSGSASTSK
jgi:ABC-type nitrate/sulfonate/bicarbonate transport system permease component